MTSQFIVFLVIVLIWIAVLSEVEHKQKIFDSLYIGMPVDTMHNGTISHGYITAFNNKTVSIVLFDAPHDLIERKITELIF